MRMTVLLLGIVLIVTLPCSLWSEPLTLSQCFERAVTESNRIKAREQDIKRSEAVYAQAMAELYPELYVSALQRFRNSDDFGSLSSGSFDDPSSGIRRSRTLGRSQFEGTLTVSQPLFRGFQEFIAADAARSEARSFELQRQREREMLLGETADLYFQILLLHDQHRIISDIERTLHNRISELREYAALGKSRESEVLAAQGDAALQTLLRARTERALAAAKELLGSLIGVPSSDIELVAPEPVSTLEPIEQLVPRLKERSDVRAKQESEKALALSAKAESRSLWPSIYLDGTTYPYEDPDRNRDWELGIQMDVPLFEGGRVDARVQEIEAQRARVRFEYAELLRNAERDLREGVQRFEGTLVEIERAGALRDKRRKNYEAQRADYALGVVTNLDVLSALAELQNAELELVQSRSAAALERVRINVILGGF